MPAQRNRHLITRTIPSVCALAGLLLTGCGILRAPDMNKENGMARLRRPERPVILIHGFLGAKLRHRDSGRVAWGTMGNILTGGDSDALALPLSAIPAVTGGDDLEAYEVYDSLWGVDFYGRIVRTLHVAGGYQVGDIDHPTPGDNAFVFVYDWRRDLAESARQLGETIQRLRRAMGRPAQRFDLLAHSQGGLIARYFVKYGAQDVLDGPGAPSPTMAGADSVGKVIMLGTPNRGSVEALKALHQGVGRTFTPMRPEVVFTMPAVYQMLPPRGEELFVDAEGRPIPLDPYDPDTWVREGWSVFSEGAQERIRKRIARSAGTAGTATKEQMEDHNRLLFEHLARQLERAQRLHAALNAPVGAGGEEGDYVAFGSDCVPTLRRVVMDGRDPAELEPVFESARLSRTASARTEEVLFGPGDGTVLMQSLLATSGGSEPWERSGGHPRFSAAFFVCDTHGVLPGNPIFQNNLLYVLLWNQGERSTSDAVAATR